MALRGAWLLLLALPALVLPAPAPSPSSHAGDGAVEGGMGAVAGVLPALALLLALAAILLGCSWCHRYRNCKLFGARRASTRSIEAARAPAEPDVAREPPAEAERGPVLLARGPLPPDNNNVSEDNNNGPISVREMQNIENNNAAVYIISENENRNALSAARGREEAAVRLNASRESVVEFEPLPVDITPQRQPRGLYGDWFASQYEEFPRNQLQYLREIGRGTFGRIVEGEVEGLAGAGRRAVAAKILERQATPAERARFLRDAVLFRDVRHENVLQLLARNLREDPWLLIFELCSMDLQQYLISNRPKMGVLNERGTPLRLECDITAGLAYLHAQGHVYGSVWSGGVLVSGADAPGEGEVRARLGHYGDARAPRLEPWSAPEVMAQPGHPEGSSSEVWSLGVVLWEVCSWGELPPAALTATTSPPRLPCPYRDHLYQVMQLCWNVHPNRRPTAAQVHALLNHLYTSHIASQQTPHNPHASSDFEDRWQRLKPNTIPKVDEHVAIVHADTHTLSSRFTRSDDDFREEPNLLGVERETIASRSSSIMSDTLPNNKSDSLTNLHGSLEDVRNIHYLTSDATVLEGRIEANAERTLCAEPVDRSCEDLEEKVDPWLAEVIANGEDVGYYRDVSDVIKNLDSILNSEKTSSSESSHQASPSRENLALHMRDVPPPPSTLVKSPGISDFQNILALPNAELEYREDDECITGGILRHSFDRNSQKTTPNDEEKILIPPVDETSERSQSKEVLELINSEKITVPSLKDLCLANSSVSSDKFECETKDCRESCDNVKLFIPSERMPGTLATKPVAIVESEVIGNVDPDTVQDTLAESLPTSEALDTHAKLDNLIDTKKPRQDISDEVESEKNSISDTEVLSMDNDSTVYMDLKASTTSLSVQGNNNSLNKGIEKDINKLYNDLKDRKDETGIDVGDVRNDSTQYLDMPEVLRVTTAFLHAEKTFSVPDVQIIKSDMSLSSPPGSLEKKDIYTSTPKIVEEIEESNTHCSNMNEGQHSIEVQSAETDEKSLDCSPVLKTNDQEEKIAHQECANISNNIPKAIEDYSEPSIADYTDLNRALESTDSVMRSTNDSEEEKTPDIAKNYEKNELVFVKNEELNTPARAEEKEENVPDYGSRVTVIKLEQKSVPDELNKQVQLEPTLVEDCAVILGPFENCTLDYFTGIKTETHENLQSDLPKEELLAFSSNFIELNLDSENVKTEQIEGPDSLPTDSSEKLPEDHRYETIKIGYSPTTPPNSPGNCLSTSPQHKYLVQEVFTQERSLSPIANSTLDQSLHDDGVDLSHIEIQLTSKLAMAENENNLNIEYSGPLSVEEPLPPPLSLEQVDLEEDVETPPECNEAPREDDNSYREGFALDEDCVRALRNELELKLPLAQASGCEPVEDIPMELPPPPAQEAGGEGSWGGRDELVVCYPGALSPILEETDPQLTAYHNNLNWTASQRTDSSESYPEPCNNTTDEITDLVTAMKSVQKEPSASNLAGEAGDQSDESAASKTFTIHKDQPSNEISMSADSLNGTDDGTLRDVVMPSTSIKVPSAPNHSTPKVNQLKSPEAETERISQISPYLLSPTIDSCKIPTDSNENASNVSKISKPTLPSDLKSSKASDTQCLSKATNMDSWCSNDTLFNVEDNFDELLMDSDGEPENDPQSRSTGTLTQEDDNAGSTYIIHDSKSEKCDSFTPDSITANNYTYTKVRTESPTKTVTKCADDDSTKIEELDMVNQTVMVHSANENTPINVEKEILPKEDEVMHSDASAIQDDVINNDLVSSAIENKTVDVINNESLVNINISNKGDLVNKTDSPNRDDLKSNCDSINNDSVCKVVQREVESPLEAIRNASLEHSLNMTPPIFNESSVKARDILINLDRPKPVMTKMESVDIACLEENFLRDPEDIKLNNLSLQNNLSEISPLNGGGAGLSPERHYRGMANSVTSTPLVVEAKDQLIQSEPQPLMSKTQQQQTIHTNIPEFEIFVNSAELRPQDMSPLIQADSSSLIVGKQNSAIPLLNGSKEYHNSSNSNEGLKDEQSTELDNKTSGYLKFQSSARNKPQELSPIDSDRDFVIINVLDGISSSNVFLQFERSPFERPNDSNDSEKISSRTEISNGLDHIAEDKTEALSAKDKVVNHLPSVDLVPNKQETRPLDLRQDLMNNSSKEDIKALQYVLEETTDSTDDAENKSNAEPVNINSKEETNYNGTNDTSQVEHSVENPNKNIPSVIIEDHQGDTHTYIPVQTGKLGSGIEFRNDNCPTFSSFENSVQIKPQELSSFTNQNCTDVPNASKADTTNPSIEFSSFERSAARKPQDLSSILKSDSYHMNQNNVSTPDSTKTDATIPPVEFSSFKRSAVTKSQDLSPELKLCSSQFSDNFSDGPNTSKTDVMNPSIQFSTFERSASTKPQDLSSVKSNNSQLSQNFNETFQTFDSHKNQRQPDVSTDSDQSDPKDSSPDYSKNISEDQEENHSPHNDETEKNHSSENNDNSHECNFESLKDFFNIHNANEIQLASDISHINNVEIVIDPAEENKEEFPIEDKKLATTSSQPQEDLGFYEPVESKNDSLVSVSEDHLHSDEILDREISSTASTVESEPTTREMDSLDNHLEIINEEVIIHHEMSTQKPIVPVESSLSGKLITKTVDIGDDQDIVEAIDELDQVIDANGIDEDIDSASASSCHSEDEDIKNHERPELVDAVEMCSVTNNFIEHEKNFSEINACLPLLRDIRFTGPSCDYMSTSFNQDSPTEDASMIILESELRKAEENAERLGQASADALKEWESESEDSQTNSTSSGEFIWKDGEGQERFLTTTTDFDDNGGSGGGGGSELGSIAEGSEGEGEGEGEGSDGSEGDEVEFVPSSWDCRAAPAKSSMKTLEQSPTDSKKRVVFKRQKYHCVYEYPREILDDCDMSGADSRMLHSAYLPDYSTYAVWEALSAGGAGDVELSYAYPAAPMHLYHLPGDAAFSPNYGLPDEDFFISSSARPFESLGIMSTTSQFFPGLHATLKAVSSVDPPDSPTDEGTEDFPPPPSPLAPTPAILTAVTAELPHLGSLDFTTPDSGVEDVTPGCAIDDDPPTSITGEISSPPPATQRTKLKLRAPESSTSSSESPSPSSPCWEALGGLRHTRDRLKLDLPPSPLHLGSGGSRHGQRVFNFLATDASPASREAASLTPLVMSDETPLVRAVPLPLEDDEDVVTPKPTFSTFGKPNSRPASTGSTDSKPIVMDEEGGGSAEENLAKAPESEATVVRNKSLPEAVKGEGTVLDSGDEDSGIESSAKTTLERNPPHRSTT